MPFKTIALEVFPVMMVISFVIFTLNVDVVMTDFLIFVQLTSLCTMEDLLTTTLDTVLTSTATSGGWVGSLSANIPKGE